jgi:hypothetical protein
MGQKAKSRYQIRNWSDYNKSLVQRGSITLWFSEDSIHKWHDTARTLKKGRPEVYSDDAILCALLVRTVFHLPLRALEGFLRSLVALLKLPVQVPSYTQICRRTKELGKSLSKLSSRRPCDVVFDSTGLKVYGEGEWKVRQHGASKRRVWRKLHIGIDPKSGEIMIGELTNNGSGCGDGETAKKLLPKLPKTVKRIFGDGGYDGIEFRKGGHEIGAEVIVPPPKGATVHMDSKDPALINRNNAVLEILGLGGDDDARKSWKILKGYHKRSLVETSMYRIKQLTGGSLRSREFSRQSVEAQIKCLVVNKMTKLGMPSGVWSYSE